MYCLVGSLVKGSIIFRFILTTNLQQRTFERLSEEGEGVSRRESCILLQQD